MTSVVTRGLAIAICVVLGVAVGASMAAFRATTSNDANTFSVVDNTAPTISAITVAKSDGTAGAVRQGATYYLYANATDDTAVTSVTGDASSFDVSAGTATTLSSGSWTINSISYNYRSALLTADSPLETGTSYPFSVTASDAVPNSATSNGTVTVDDYASTILATSGLTAYWRMGSDATANDFFTDATGTVLTSHSTNLTWTKLSGNNTVITDLDRARRSGTGASVHYATTTPSSANYGVQADLTVKSLPSGSADIAGVVGRLDTGVSSGTFYTVRYVVDSAQWSLARSSAGTISTLATYNQTLSAGSTYNMRLAMNGSTISMYIDNVLRGSATDANITATGKGGLRLGGSSSTNSPTDSTGLHVDDFQIVPVTGTTLADSKGTNTGTLVSSPVLNVKGALLGDTNTAMRFDGTSDYATVPNASAVELGDGPLTLEAWVHRHDNSAEWDDIFNKGTNGYQLGYHYSDFALIKEGVALIADYTNGGADITSWHHVAATKTGSTVRLYYDGTDVTPGSYTNQTLSNTFSTLYIATLNGTTHFLNAELDELATYNSVLSAATILDHYKVGTGTG